MYALTKFQPDMPITLGVMALQSGNNKKIDLYSKHWENKLQALTKTAVVYEWKVTWVVTCTILFAMNRCIYCWVSIFLLHHV